MTDAGHERAASSGPRSSRRLINVAVPLPFHRTLTYAVDGEPRHPVVAGSRVVVPVRGRKVVGFSLGDVGAADHQTPVARLQSVVDVPDAEPSFRPDLVSVCEWIAKYYVVPLGLVLRAALPSVLGDVKRTQPAEKTRRLVTITRRLETLLEREAAFKRAPQQRAAYELLESLGGIGEVARVIERLGCSAAVIDGLVKRGLARFDTESVARDPFLQRAAPAAPRDLKPTDAQRVAIDALMRAEPGSVTLLRGVTGSGKTLVYIELLKRVLERGRTAIVLVPEIALTPQTVDRFRAVFGDKVAVLHSALGEGERYDQWRALRSGEKRIVVGARSAVFAPLPDLGAIVVDEEHEASYKQGEAPRYHARDVAIVRARAAGAVCVLGSATPSLESWQNAATGKYKRLDLPGRVGGGSLPAVEVVDLRAATKQPRDVAERALRVALSERLEELIGDRLEKKEQVILLLNRRGYASFVQCSACEWVAECPNCSISLTLHRNPEAMTCHYCLHREEPRLACPRCAQPTLRQRGLGTQQVERLLSERFPRARIARMDVDTTHGKWAHATILDRVGSGEVDILFGTQMIAKGLDFPNVTLVGVIDADIGINLPDFRASERAFQLVSQVAGRAGRGPKGGVVIVQTRLPKHHAIRCAMDHDYERFVAEELPERANPAYPPTVRLANVVISGTNESATVDFARESAAKLERHLAKTGEKDVELVGPAPCPVERIQQRWRWHFLVRSPDAQALSRVARRFVRGLEVPSRGGLRVVFDRDPVTLL